jgi:hypothetical protein
MAFKLSKADRERRDGYVTSMREAEAKIDDAVSTYNAEMGLHRASVEAAVEAFNQILEEARGFCEDIATEADGQIDDKSEKWQEGDKGQAAVAWKDAWEQIELDALELDWPDDLAVEGADQMASDLEALDIEAGD